MSNYYNENGLAQYSSTHATKFVRDMPGVAMLLHAEEEHFGEVGETINITWEVDSYGNDHAIAVNTY